MVLVSFRGCGWGQTAESGDESSPGSDASGAQQLVSKQEEINEECSRISHSFQQLYV